ncbi:MAG: hypothetical protein RIR79_1766 [Pseudomonadota bacterium]|jgi:peptidyl-prolyl cis-trans isomerase D
MFDFVRKHTKAMMILMFLLIIPAFVLVGVDGFSRISALGDIAASVDGHSITQTDWDNAHKTQIERVRSSNPGIDVKLLDTPEARYSTLENLVRENVLLAAVRGTYLVTTDSRLARELQANPVIASLRHADGSFDKERYQQLAAAQGMTTEGLENSIRQQLSLRVIDQGVPSSAFTSTALTNVALNAFFERREVQITPFMATDYLTKVNPSDADIEAFYKTNAKLFEVPETASVEYVVLDLENIKKSITLNEQDVKKYYEQNIAKFTEKEERRASHILINASKDMPAADRKKARELAESLLIQVRKTPASFADVAKKHSQDPGSALSGGDLDYFARGAMVKPFDNAAFAMKTGEISDIVESDFGFHIIKLTDIKGGKQRSFEELKTTIEADLKTQEAQKKFPEVAESFTNAVYEQSDNLKSVAERFKLEIKVADGVVRKALAGSKGTLAHPKLLTAIFSTDSIEKKRNTEAVEVGTNQLAAARITQYHAAHIRPLAEIRDNVKSRLVFRQAADVAKKEGAEKLTQWRTNAPSTLPAAVIVTREGQPNVASEVLNAVLQADTSKLPAWIGIDLGGKGYAVARINQVLPRTPSTEANAALERQQLGQMLSQAENQAYHRLLEQRYKTEIKPKRPTRSAQNLAETTN